MAGGYDATLKFQTFADNVENIMYFDLLSEKARLGGRRGLEKYAKQVRKITQDGIKNPPKTGVKYRNLRVRSSRAGEYPANQTGRLRRSIGYQMLGNEKVFVGSRIYYSRFLAFGTRNMGIRKFIGTAIKDSISEGYDLISNEINKELGIQ